MWVEGTVDGIYRRHSLKVSSWDRAEQKKREIEEGAVKSGPITIPEALAKFIADAESRHLRPPSLRKLRHLTRTLQEFAEAKGLRFVGQIDASVLRDFRATWKDAAITAQKKLERMRSVFKFFVDSEWISRNPASLIKSPVTHVRAVEPFSPDEETRILETAYRLSLSGNPAKPGELPVNPKTGTFTKLLIHSGLRITDAAMLRRDRIRGDRLLLYATKNKKTVSVPLPADLVRELHSFAGDELFESPQQSCRPETVSDYWRDQLRKVFDASGISGGHPHRFRHSLAVKMLNSGSSVEDVAAVLGNSPAIVAKYYSAWVQTRQDRIDQQIKKAWKGRGADVARSKKKPVAAARSASSENVSVTTV